MRSIGLLAVCLVTSACGNGAASPPAAVPVVIATSAKLQLGVGTATIDTDAGSFVGTNFTMTFRGADGNNATGVNTPTLTGPAAFKIGFPGSSNSLHGMSPLAFSNFVTTGIGTSDFIESLGPYVGVFGYGLASDNLVSSQLTKQISATYKSSCTDLVSSGDPTVQTGAVFDVEPSGLVVPGATYNSTGSAISNELGLPLGSGNQNALQANCPTAASTGATQPLLMSSLYPVNYYGGPPAWPSPQGYGAPSFFVGFPLGFTDTAATPVTGAYKLDVAYPTAADYSTSAHLTASATLNQIVPLPVMPKPSLVVKADGSGIVSINVPAGLLETIVEIRTTDCRPPNVGFYSPNNYSQVLRTSGPQSIFFASHLGPPDSTGAPSPTFCSTGTTALVSAIGFDYPAYESSYPFDNSVLPKITNGDGHTGQADVTTSAPLLYPNPTQQNAALRRRR